MRTLGITPAVKEERTLSVKDFSAYCKRAVNLSSRATCQNETLCHGAPSILTLKPLKVYSTDCGTVAYCADKKLYRLQDGKTLELANLTFDAPPEVFCITADGVKSLCAVENSKGVIVGDRLSFVNFPVGQGYINHKGVLFCYNGEKIVYGGNFDYSGYSVTVKEEGFIGVQNIGRILNLFTDGKTVTAVCERGLAHLRADGFFTDYKLEYSSALLDLQSGDSVKQISETVYFFKDGGLYSVKNDTLKRLNTPLDNAEYSFYDKAFTVGERYLLPITDGAEKFLFVYDTATENSYFITANANAYSDGGYYALTDGYAVGRLVIGNAQTYEWQSVTTDLGSDAEKTLYKISLKSVSPVTLTVSGDHGVRVIKMDSGYKSVRLNLKSREFSLKLNGNVFPFGVEYMKLYYRI